MRAAVALLAASPPVIYCQYAAGARGYERTERVNCTRNEDFLHDNRYLKQVGRWHFFHRPKHVQDVLVEWKVNGQYSPAYDGSGGPVLATCRPETLRWLSLLNAALSGGVGALPCGEWTLREKRHSAGWLARILSNERRKLSLVTFHGNLETVDWFESFAVFPGPFRVFGKDIQVHWGFMKRWRVIRDWVREEFNRIQDHSVAIAGHSSGAAVASLAVLDLMDRATLFTDKGKGAYLSAVFFYGSPLYATRSFVDMWQAKVGCDRTATLQLSYDPVPLIRLPKYMYQTMCPATLLKNKKMQHSFNWYQQILESLEGTPPFKFKCPKEPKTEHDI